MAEERQAQDGERLENVPPRVRVELEPQLCGRVHVIDLDAAVSNLIGWQGDTYKETEKVTVKRERETTYQQISVLRTTTGRCDTT